MNMFEVRSESSDSFQSSESFQEVDELASNIKLGASVIPDIQHSSSIHMESKKNTFNQIYRSNLLEKKLSWKSGQVKSLKAKIKALEVKSNYGKRQHALGMKNMEDKVKDLVKTNHKNIKEITDLHQLELDKLKYIHEKKIIELGNELLQKHAEEKKLIRKSTNEMLELKEQTIKKQDRELYEERSQNRKLEINNKELSNSHSLTLKRKIENHHDEIVSLSKKQQLALEQLKTLHELENSGKIQNLKAKQSEVIRLLKMRIRAEEEAHEDTRKKSSTAMAEAHGIHNSAIQTLSKKHQQETESLKKQHELQLAISMKNQAKTHRSEIDRSKSLSENDIGHFEELLKRSDAQAKFHKSKVKEFEEKHDAVLKKHVNTLNEKEKMSADLLRKTINLHTEEISKIKAEYENKQDAAVREIVESNLLEMQQMKDVARKTKIEMDEIKIKHKAEVDSLNCSVNEVKILYNKALQKHDVTMNKQKQQHENDLLEVERKYEEKLSVSAKKLHSDYIKKTSNLSEIHYKKFEELETKLRDCEINCAAVQQAKAIELSQKDIAHKKAMAELSTAHIGAMATAAIKSNGELEHTVAEISDKHLSEIKRITSLAEQDKQNYLDLLEKCRSETLKYKADVEVNKLNDAKTLERHAKILLDKEKDHEATLHEVKQVHEKHLSKQANEHDLKCLELAEKFKKQQDDTLCELQIERKRHGNTLSEWESKYNHAIQKHKISEQRMENAHHLALEEIRKELNEKNTFLAAKYSRENAVLVNDLKSIHEKQIRSLQSEQYTAINKLKDNHAKDVKGLELELRNWEIRCNKNNNTHAAMIRGTETAQRDAIHTLRQKHEVELSDVVRKYHGERKVTITDLKSKHRAEVEALNTKNIKLQNESIEWEEKYANLMNSTSINSREQDKKLHKQISELEEYRRTIAEMSVKHQKKITDLTLISKDWEEKHTKMMAKYHISMKDKEDEHATALDLHLNTLKETKEEHQKIKTEMIAKHHHELEKQRGEFAIGLKKELNRMAKTHSKVMKQHEAASKKDQKRVDAIIREHNNELKQYNKSIGSFWEHQERFQKDAINAILTKYKAELEISMKKYRGDLNLAIREVVGRHTKEISRNISKAVIHWLAIESLKESHKKEFDSLLKNRSESYKPSDVNSKETNYADAVDKLQKKYQPEVLNFKKSNLASALQCEVIANTTEWVKERKFDTG